MSWTIAIGDDDESRVVLTVEEVGRPGTGMVAHLTRPSPADCGSAIADAPVEIGDRPDG